MWIRWMAVVVVVIGAGVPLKRVQRLIDQERWGSAAAVCEARGASESSEPAFRELCARAEFEAGPPEGVEGLSAFYERWVGTTAAAEAHESAAAATEPPTSATPEELLAHAQRFPGTDAGTRSAARADDEAFQRAVGLGTESAYDRYLRTFPNGEFVEQARLRAFELGLKTAISGAEPVLFEDLVARYPAHRSTIREAAAKWAIELWAKALDGPCWSTPCDAIERGRRVTLTGPSPPLTAAPTIGIAWVLVDAGGSLVPWESVAPSMGLDSAEAVPMLEFRVDADAGRAVWDAPLPWAQPPAAFEVSWAVQISVEGSPPVNVPFRSTRAWQETDETLFTWGREGVKAWRNDGERLLSPTPCEWPCVLFQEGRTLWTADGPRLVAIDLISGITQEPRTPTDFSFGGGAGAGAVHGWSEGRRVRCDLGGCEPYPEGVRQIASGNGSYLLLRSGHWFVYDSNGDLLISFEGVAAGREGWRSAWSGVVNVAMDSSGNLVAVLSFVEGRMGGKSYVLVEVVELSSRKVISEGRYDFAGGVDWIEDARATPRPGTWLFEARYYSGQGRGTVWAGLLPGRGLVTKGLGEHDVSLVEAGAWGGEGPLPLEKQSEYRAVAVRTGDLVDWKLYSGSDLVADLPSVTDPVWAPRQDDETSPDCSWEVGTALAELTGGKYLWVSLLLHACTYPHEYSEQLTTRSFVWDVLGRRSWPSQDLAGVWSRMSPSGRKLLLMGSPLLPADSHVLVGRSNPVPLNETVYGFCWGEAALTALPADEESAASAGRLDEGPGE